MVPSPSDLVGALTFGLNLVRTSTFVWLSGRRDESKLAWVTIAVGIGSVAIDGRHKQ